MTKSLKKKLNLTIDEVVLQHAKQVAEQRGESLSQVIESFLSKLPGEKKSSLAETYSSQDWLSEFHHRHAKLLISEPSDQDLKRLLLKRDG